MADGRICDGISFAQIKPDLRYASMPDRMDHSSTERRVGVRSPGPCPSLGVTLSIRHHLGTNLRPSTVWTGLLEAQWSQVEVLGKVASSGGTGASCWR